jgi:hypothetical protein
MIAPTECEMEVAASFLTGMNLSKVEHLSKQLAQMTDVRFSQRFDPALKEIVWTWTGRRA